MDGTVPSSKKYLGGIVASSKKLVDGTVTSCKKLVDGTVSVVNIIEILQNNETLKLHSNLHIFRSVSWGFVNFDFKIVSG